MNIQNPHLPIQCIGLMSGTSVDGLDVCCATFDRKDGQWSFHIDCARGYEYPAAMKKTLGADVQKMSALEFVTFHSAYGQFLGERVNDFMKEFGVAAPCSTSRRRRLCSRSGTVPPSPP